MSSKESCKDSCASVKHNTAHDEGHDHDTCCCCCKSEHSHDDCCSVEQYHDDNCDCCAGDHCHDDCCDDDGCGCGCGCGHSKEKGDRKIQIIKISLSAALIAAGIVLSVLKLDIFSLIAYASAVIIGGYSIFINGAKSLVKFDINESLLMSISVIAAFVIGEAFEGAMVTLLFGIGEILEDLAIAKSRDRIKSLSQIRPDTANLLLSDGSTRQVDANSVQTGDIIAIAPHERVPLDGIVTEGDGELDASAITGESLPKSVKAGSEVLSGMMNGSTLIKIRVTNRFENSAASRILSMVENASARKGKTEKLISRFAKIYTPIVVVLAILTTVTAPLLGLGEFSDWIHRALVFLVASCPCAMVISVPLCYYAGIGAASKKGILVKGSRYVEAVAEADAVVFDKTGTLTEGKLSVTKIICADGFDENKLLQMALAVEKYSDHPVAAAVKEYCGEKGIAEINAEKHEEIPGTGVRAIVDGHIIECVKRSALDNVNLADGENASVILKMDSKTIGAFVISGRIRDDAKDTVSRLKKLGISKIAMFTGDSTSAADALAVQCGIDEVHAELMPEGKLEKLQDIAKTGKKVIFVGDGINDAPVLAFADAGVAMGLGTDAAIESADMVLSFDRLSDLPEAIGFFRKVCAKAKGNIIFALAVKLAVLVLAVCGIAPMWLAVFADVGVTLIAVANSTLLMK